MKSKRTLFLVSVTLFVASLVFAQAPAAQQPPAAPQRGQGRGGRGGQRGAPAQPQASPVRSVFLEELTWYEVRDAITGGNTVGIVPTGGTEKNGFHMTMGKHNFHIRKGAEMLAEKLGNALIAPVLQYVPESQATENTPGVLSCPGACFEHVVEAAARSLKAGGFKDILLVGDNGGNQNGLRNVADKLNKEWEGSDTKVFALTDYYEKGHEYLEAWLLAQFGWDAQTVGSHAGIQDTSQMLYVKPEDVRKDRIAESFNNRQESSVSGDPTKATAEFGRIALEFKANAAVAQYRAMKAPPRGRGGRGGGGGR
jgi:creatinine amidohydrolase